MGTFQSQYIDNSSTFRWEIVGQYIYLGSGSVGISESDARWAIQKVDKTNGNILHAEGSADFVNQWDQRASYTYS